MVQQGDSHRRDEDNWWHELYGPAAGRPSGPAPSRSDSIDDHFAGVRKVMDGSPPGDGGLGRGSGGETPGAGDAIGDRDDGGGRRLPSPGARGTAPGRSTGDSSPAGPPSAPAPGTGGAAESTPAVPAPQTLRLRRVSGRSGAVASEPGVPDEPPAHVGDRPPTYAPEPTAWPAADPEDLDSLTPDTVLDGGQYGVLTLRAVSVRGDSARYRGQPRRDALLAARFGEGAAALLLVAVASGARAAEDSHRAAREACRWIASSVGRHSERLADDIRAARRGTLKSGLHRLTDRCLGQLRLRAEELGYEPDEYSASLRCLLLPADPECRTRVFFGVGEGGLFRLREGQWQDLDPHRDPRPSAGTSPSGGTHAPDDPADRAGSGRAAAGQGAGGQGTSGRAGGAQSVADAAPAPRFRFRASVGRPGDVLLLCTEGMAEPLREEPALAQVLAERWAAPAQPPGLAGFLRDAQVRAKGYADDRTAAAAWEA